MSKKIQKKVGYSKKHTPTVAPSETEPKKPIKPKIEISFPIEPNKHANQIYNLMVVSFVLEILILLFPERAALVLVMFGLTAEYLLQLRLFAASILMLFFITKSDLWIVITDSHKHSKFKFFIGLGIFIAALLVLIKPDSKIILNNLIPIIAGIIAIFNLLVGNSTDANDASKSDSQLAREIAARSLVLLVSPSLIARLLILITVVEIALLGQPIFSLTGAYFIFALVGFFGLKPQ